MTTKAERTRLVRLIHVAKRELNLSDETYQDILYVTTGETSCAMLSFKQLYAVIERLKEKGFSVKTKITSRNPAQVKKILDMWRAFAATNTIKDGSLAALNAYIKRMTAQRNGGIGIDSIRWLDNGDASHVIECMKQWNKRIDPK